MKKAIIIGASSGIGHQLATILVRKGYKVGITGRRAKELENLKAIDPDNFICSSFDCTKENNSVKLDELASKMGGLDLLVFCSGTGDLNNNLKIEIENNTNQLNVIAFAEIAVWSFNFLKGKTWGILWQ